MGFSISQSFKANYKEEKEKKYKEDKAELV
jgi:hypothetical protein